MAEWERPSLSSGSNPRASKARSAKPHRLRWAIVAAAVVATVGFGWASWSAYKAGGPSGGGIVPFLKADSEPTRIRPDNPGGMPIPNQDKAIYDKLDPRRAPPKGVERLLPPPESPVSRPPAVDAKVPEEPEPAGAKPSIPSLSETAQPAARDVGTATIKAPVEPEPPSPPPSAAAPSPFTKLEAPPAPPKSAAKPAPAPREQTASVSPSPSPSPPPPAPKAEPKVPAAGSLRVQLGAVGSEDAAHKEWERIRRANSDLLGAMSPAIVRADLGAKGVVYRIQAGPVAGADAAADLCAKLKTRNVGCFVAR